MDDEGVGYVAQLPLLRVLYISDSVMTDAGLRALGEMITLDYLLVGSDSISEAEVERLRKQLPDAEIHAFGPDFAD